MDNGKKARVMTLVRSPSDVDDSAMAVDQTTSHVNLPRKRQIRPPPRYSHLNSAARGPNTQNDSASTAELGKLKKKRVANETSPANLQGVSSGGTNIETPKSETTHSGSSLDSGSSESIPNIDTPNGTTIRNMSDLNDQKVFGEKKQAKPVVKPKIEQPSTKEFPSVQAFKKMQNDFVDYNMRVFEAQANEISDLESENLKKSGQIEDLQKKNEKLENEVEKLKGKVSNLERDLAETKVKRKK